MRMRPASCRESTTWTLGRFDGENYWYCVYCGRNCLADGLPFMGVERLDAGPQMYACECCFWGNCLHTQPIVIECDRCRRPVARLTFGGGGITLIGSITPEGQMEGGGHSPDGPTWRSRIWDVSIGGPSWDRDGQGGSERFKIVCVARRHRTERLVTRAALQNAYVDACTLDRRRIRLSDLRRT